MTIERLFVLGIAVLVMSVVVLAAKSLRQSNREVRWAYGILAVLLAVLVLRFLPGPIADLLVTHVFTEEDGLLHVHTIELLELGCLTLLAALAWTSQQARLSRGGLAPARFDDYRLAPVAMPETEHVTMLHRR